MSTVATCTEKYEEHQERWCKIVIDPTFEDFPHWISLTDGQALAEASESSSQIFGADHAASSAGGLGAPRATGGVFPNARIFPARFFLFPFSSSFYFCQISSPLSDNDLQ